MKLSAVARAALTVLFFGLAYFILQRLTFTLRFPPIQRTTIWTPGALCFTALLLTPARQWWIYYVGVSLGTIAAFYDDGAITVQRAMLMTPFHFGAVILAVSADRTAQHYGMYGRKTISGLRCLFICCRIP